MISKIKNKKSKIKAIVFFLMSVFIVGAYACQKVEKPSKDAAGLMKITMEVDEAPDSHTENTTSEGKKLVNPYSKIPVVGSMFKSSLTGLDFWKANHPNLVTGTNNPALIVETEDEEELCLDCHDQTTSCNNCHGYVGVGLVTSDEE